MTEKTRINRVTTRTGDAGDTGLANGTRVAKDHPRVQAMGDVDELNACLGVLLASAPGHHALLSSLQQVLFEIGAELAIPDSARLTDEQVQSLEQHSSALNEQLAPLREFILPGGSQAAAWCHYCRTVARRAERSLVQLNHDEPVNGASLRWLNRLSDVLFVLARTLNHDAGHGETFWQPGSSPA